MIPYDYVKFEAYIPAKDARNIAATLKKDRGAVVILTKINSDLEFKLQTSTFIAEHNVEYESFPPYEKVIPEKTEGDTTQKFAVSITQLEIASNYLKSVFEPKAKGNNVHHATVTEMGSTMLDPIVMYSENIDCKVKIVIMPVRV